MRKPIRKGFGFGLTSGIITTLGLIVGLNSSTHSKFIVLGGILIIAIADALSDAMGIHISEEFELKHTKKEIWEATNTTFVTKLVASLSFAVPILLFPLNQAIILSIIWGLSLITIFSYYIAKQEKARPYMVVLEHLIITVIVIFITRALGGWVTTLS